ncbi:hypothetical protein [Streptomyces sp. NPDC046805]|uniref:hypothetical protein n=1 Tax=Streptomyces sp. NPDC046805 TaxID=3155134 RepID=UPI0033C4C56C
MRSVQHAENRPQLLVIDYPGRRDTGHVGDMRLEEHGFDVRYTMRAELPKELHGDAYARRLIDESKIDPNSVVAIVAYCMAAHLAQESAAQLTAVSGMPLPLIVLDSGPCLAETVAAECRSVFELFDGAELAAEVDRGALTHLFEAEALRTDPAHTVEEFRVRMRLLARNMLADDVETEEELEEASTPLVNLYVGWLTHLIAAHNSSAPAWGGDVLHLTSHGHPFRADWPGAVSTSTLTVDCTENELLSSKSTRDSLVAHIQNAHVVPFSA